MDLSLFMERLTLKNEFRARSSIQCRSLEINGHRTDIAYFDCDEETLMIATQHTKAGSLMKIELEQFEIDSVTKNVYAIKHLFGDIPIEQEAVGRYIAELLNTKKPLIMSINLVECNRVVADQIARVAKELSI